MVLISLNGRIYYEIKRRYKNVLLQRHSAKISDPSNTNNNSFFTPKSTQRRQHSCSPMTMTLCDSDRQYCSTTINFTDNDSLVMSKVSSKSGGNPHNESILRINFKEKKNRSILSRQSSDNRNASLERNCSYLERNPCKQVRMFPKTCASTASLLYSGWGQLGCSAARTRSFGLQSFDIATGGEQLQVPFDTLASFGCGRALF